MLVIIPTFNEIESLPLIVTGLREQVPAVHLLIVDDNSPDGTGELADQMANTDANIQVLHRTQKNGLGAAYLAGFAWAKANSFQVVVEMDADGSHRTADLPKLLNALVNADVVLGSRWVSGGEVVNWPLSRKILSRGGNIYTRLLLNIPLHDATGGFRAYRMSALDAMNVQTVQSQGYCFQVDLAWRAIQNHLRVVEVPITFVEREFGESKMDSRIVKEALRRVTVWGLTKRLDKILRIFRD
ncbi:MAG: polyprenol monophosphomannose synthase [Actinobacteria bacterium]|nr:polyprenol monophosphomannose synthase [Actinomycetota bacterium]NBY15780.1 polyprenol monophosphomannose synthase [Actinomycetota bacterium]